MEHNKSTEKTLREFYDEVYAELQKQDQEISLLTQKGGVIEFKMQMRKAAGLSTTDEDRERITNQVQDGWYRISSTKGVEEL